MDRLRSVGSTSSCRFRKVEREFCRTIYKIRIKHNLFYLHRTNSEGTFEAIFSAVLSVDGQTATGTLVNTSGMHGMMLMVRREALSRYKHLLESDTAQQTELAGTKAPSEAVSMTYPRVSKHWKQPSTKSGWRRQSKCLKDWTRTKTGKSPIKKCRRRNLKIRYGYKPILTAT